MNISYNLISILNENWKLIWGVDFLWKEEYVDDYPHISNVIIPPDNVLLPNKYCQRNSWNIYKLLGGEIYGGYTYNGKLYNRHFINKIDGKFYDFTKEPESLQYYLKDVTNIALNEGISQAPDFYTKYFEQKKTLIKEYLEGGNE